MPTKSFVDVKFLFDSKHLRSRLLAGHDFIGTANAAIDRYLNQTAGSGHARSFSVTKAHDIPFAKF